MSSAGQFAVREHVPVPLVIVTIPAAMEQAPLASITAAAEELLVADTGKVV